MRIQGQKVTLRDMEKADVAHKVKWFNDPDVNKTLLVEEKLELYKSLEWFERTRNDDSRRDFVIETKEGKPIGIIALVHINTVHGTAEIYIVIGEKDFWGKGVMLEAESLLIDWAFNSLKLEKIWADALTDNIASVITMKKIGFKIEGTLRCEKVIDGKRVDIIRAGRIKDEFQNTVEK
jgi:RimJ/RimL family protein N-acetyltransferase